MCSEKVKIELPEPEFLYLSDLTERWSVAKDQLVALIGRGCMHSFTYYKGECMYVGEYIKWNSSMTERDRENNRLLSRTREEGLFYIGIEFLSKKTHKENICIEYLFKDASRDFKFFLKKDFEEPHYGSVRLRKDWFNLEISWNDVVIPISEVKRIEEKYLVKSSEETNNPKDTSTKIVVASALVDPPCFGNNCPDADCPENGLLDEKRENSHEIQSGILSSTPLGAVTDRLETFSEPGICKDKDRENATIEEKIKKASIKKENQREKNNNLRLIGALVALIKGECLNVIGEYCDRNCQFKNVSCLIKALTDKVAKGVDGMSVRTLENRFASLKNVERKSPMTESAELYIVGALYELLRNDSKQELPLRDELAIIDILDEMFKEMKDIGKVLLSRIIREANEKYSAAKAPKKHRN